MSDTSRTPRADHEPSSAGTPVDRDDAHAARLEFDPVDLERFDSATRNIRLRGLSLMEMGFDIIPSRVLDDEQDDRRAA